MRRTTALTAIACSILLGVPAAAQNLLTNPDFNANVAGWTPVGSGSVTWNALDANASASSGSARLVTPSAEGSTVIADVGCVDDATTLCLNDGRFRVGVAWRTPEGQTGAGNAVRLTSDTGYFWFFNAANVEIVLKVLDACLPPFEHFWVFIAGLTNVQVEITVFDTVAEEERTYFNPLDRPFEPVQDTSVFATCP